MLLLLQPQRPALERGLAGGSPALLLSRAVHRRLQHFYLYKKKLQFLWWVVSLQYRSTGNKTPFPPQIRYVSRVTGDKAILLAVMTFINLPYVVLVMAWWLLQGLLYFLLLLFLFFPSKLYTFICQVSRVL